VVKFRNAEPFVIADIPGLIEGAHKGLGLGQRFLRHIERTAVLVHILDISQTGSGNAWKNYATINAELDRFKKNLLGKTQIVAFNKIDLPETREKMKTQMDRFSKEGIKVFPISAATGEGIEALLKAILKTLREPQ
jgi:GTP-binding protein